MPRSNGVFSLLPIYQATPGTTIRSEQHNAPLEDIANALTGSLPRDGSAPMQANLQMGGRKVTGLGAPTAAGDAATKAYADGLTPTETSIDMTGPGLIGKGTAGNGKSLRITFGDGLRLLSGALTVNLGAGLSIVSSAIVAAVSRFSTATEAQERTNNDSAMTPLRTEQAINAAFQVVGSAPIYACRSWGAFNGNSGSVSRLGGGNFANVSRERVGEYVITFAVSMQDSNYAIIPASSAGDSSVTVLGRTSSTFRIQVNRDDVDSDADYVSFAVFR